jgi:hypothetical protein
MRLLIIALVISLKSSCLACSCFRYNNYPVESILFNAFSFEGKIISVAMEGGDFETQTMKAVFMVKNWLSPDSGSDTISVYTQYSSCALDFSKGDSWVIFANYFEGKLQSSICDLSSKIDSTKASRDWLKKLDQLSTGSHDIAHEYDEYNLSGRLENGEPVGQWFKILGADTLAFYNFVDGSQEGMQMETDQAKSSLQRHYHSYERKSNNAIVFKRYDHKMNLQESCEFSEGPLRYRYADHNVPGGALYLFSSNFRISECEDF